MRRCDFHTAPRSEIRGYLALVEEEHGERGGGRAPVRFGGGEQRADARAGNCEVTHGEEWILMWLLEGWRASVELLQQGQRRDDPTLIAVVLFRTELADGADGLEA